MEEQIKQIQIKLGAIETQLLLLKQIFNLEGNLKVISIGAELTNKLASTPRLYNEYIFIDSINNRLYVYGTAWKYTALT